MMKKAKFDAVNPVLPTKDVSAAIEFYTQELGFELRGQDSTDDPRYAVIVRDHVELHLQWHDAAQWARGEVERPMLRFVVPEIELLFEEYADKGVFHERTDLRETLWGTKEFAFYDLDQNGLTFYKDL